MGKKEYPLKRGDHLVVRRDFYDHHGIYLGKRRVVHFTGDKPTAAVRQDDITRFIGRSRLFVRKYRMDTLSRGETCKRAKRMLRDGQRNPYRYVSNNCEHFASLCKTGRAASTQITEMAEILRFATISPTVAVGRVELARDYKDVKIRTYVLRH